MLSQYLFILLFTAMALVVPVMAIMMGHLLGPRHPDPVKNAVYESGMETIGDTWVQFRAQYYLIALIFVVFDVEAVFLFPIALAYKDVNALGAGAAIFFILLLLVGLLYDWRKGALEWQ